MIVYASRIPTMHREASMSRGTRTKEERAPSQIQIIRGAHRILWVQKGHFEIYVRTESSLLLIVLFSVSTECLILQVIPKNP